MEAEYGWGPGDWRRVPWGELWARFVRHRERQQKKASERKWAEHQANARNRRRR